MEDARCDSYGIDQASSPLQCRYTHQRNEASTQFPHIFFDNAHGLRADAYLNLTTGNLPDSLPPIFEPAAQAEARGRSASFRFKGKRRADSPTP